MAFLYEAVKEVEKKYKQADLSHENLERLFVNVINDVRASPKFPENAQEILYELSGDGKSDLSLLQNLNYSYALTKPGVLKAWKLKIEGSSPNFKVETLPTEKFIEEESRLDSLKAVSHNLIKIIKKYDIGIDLKKYKRLMVVKDK